MSENFSIPTPGDVIAGKYRVMEELGRGAYGVVFRAEQTGLGRNVALKTLLPAAFLQMDIVQRFHREAQLIATLDHENIIKLYDYGMDGNLLYMAVEYVEGRTLGELIKWEAPLPEQKVREIMTQLLSALAFAHSHGIVHRDLKPDNILLFKTPPEEGHVDEVVKVLDFGIAKLVRGDQENSALKTLTQDGTVLGTPHYMSPENIVGDTVDHKTDLYAVGIILYEMLTGKHPFEAQSPSAVMVRHLRDDAPHLPEPWTHSVFDHVILRCLAKQPEDRVASAQEIQRLLDGPAPPPPVAVIPEPEVSSVTMSSPSTSALLNVGPPLPPSKARWVVAGLMVILLTSLTWKVWTALSGVERVAEIQEPVADPQVAVVAEPEIIKTPEPEPVEDPDAGKGPEDGSVGFEFQEEEVPRPRPKDKRPKEVESAVKEMVTLSITTTPANASVTIDGVPVGNTPLEHSVLKDEGSLTIRISLLGYKNEVLKISPTQNIKRDLKLEFERIKMFD